MPARGYIYTVTTSHSLFNSPLGLPPGVLNIVHGGVGTVNAICDHPMIKAISFVGGDRAGKHIYERFVLASTNSYL